MKPAPFTYARPATLPEASRQLTEGGAAIAGGQSLVPMLALRVAAAEKLVSLRDLASLRETHRIDGGVRIGAGITHADIEDGKFEDPSGGFMKRVAAGIAYRSVRNHGTIGGSVALADPAADWPACLLALGASVRISGPRGDRVEPIDAFLRGAYTTSLEPGEIITAFDVPALPAGARVGWNKVVRKSGAFAMSIGCVVLETAKRASVVLGGTTTRPALMEETAVLAMLQTLPDEATLRAAIGRDLAHVAPDADDYQRRLHTATLLRAIKEARA